MEPVVRSSESFASFADHYRYGPVSHFPQEHRRGGTFGVKMVEVEQSTAEFFDPPFEEFNVVGHVSAFSRAELDFGDGWTAAKQSWCDFVGPQPANQACGFRLHDPHKLIVASALSIEVSTQLEKIGISGDPFRSVYAQLDHSPIMMFHLKAMWVAMEAGGLANNLLVDGHYVALLGQMLCEQGDRKAFAVVPDIANPALRRVVDYIEVHFDVPLLTSELAGIASMSVAQFGRSFKAATGFSPHHYVTTRRIEHAKTKLRQNTLTITQIAYCCGFSSAAHFSTTFGKHVGLPPSKYREQFAVH